MFRDADAIWPATQIPSQRPLDPALPVGHGWHWVFAEFCSSPSLHSKLQLPPLPALPSWQASQKMADRSGCVPSVQDAHAMPNWLYLVPVHLLQLERAAFGSVPARQPSHADCKVLATFP